MLADLNLPTMLIWGEQDHVVPLGVAKHYESGLPNARREVVPDAGHLVEMEEPKVVTKLIKHHLGTT